MGSKTKVEDSDVLPKLDAERGELRTSEGEDWVMISGEALRRIYQNDVSVLSTGACVIWYNAGKSVGKTDGAKFAEMVERLGIDELARELSESYAKLGWGRIEVGKIDLVKSELVVTMRNSPMVRGVRDSEPRCWYVRGFMEGIISVILGVEATANEIQCQAANGDRCVFKVAWTPPSDSRV